MKKSAIILLGISFLFITCQPETILPDSDLSYSGINQSAPLLPKGIHEAAARFTPDQVSAFAGQNLIAVDFFLQDLPTKCIVRIYGQGTSIHPGNLLHEQEVSSGVAANSWNRYDLATPIPITTEDLWISILVQHNDRLASVGCDPGPALENGDWLLIDAPSSPQWQTFRQYSNQGININWNIRGFVGR